MENNRFKSCIIPPRAHVELMHLGDSYFCLAQQYAKDKEYAMFFQQAADSSKFIILDNGAGDHDTINFYEYIEVIKELRPSEAISIDVLFNKNQTIQNLSRFIRAFEENKIDNVDIFYCAQGSTFGEWYDCYKVGIDTVEVKTIGMSKLAIPGALFGQRWVRDNLDKQVATSRKIVYNALVALQQITKPLHFLGAEDPREFKNYLQDPMCRSNDSCYAILAGYNEIEWKEGNFTRIATPSNYFDLELSDKQLQIAIDNIKYIQDVAHKL